MRMTTLVPPTVDIGWAQTIRKGWLLALVAAVGVSFALGASRWSDPVREAIEWAGVGLIFVCISGRTWCALYIGGRKTSELVTTGPYSVSRNPLYGFSVIGAAGVGAQIGALSVALLAGVFAWLIHLLVAIQEERLLLSQHGDTYRRYLAEVPRFLPRLALWKDAEFLEVRPRSVVTTFFDACVFLAAIPLGELFEHLHRSGILPAVLTLP